MKLIFALSAAIALWFSYLHSEHGKWIIRFASKSDPKMWTTILIVGFVSSMLFVSWVTCVVYLFLS